MTEHMFESAPIVVSKPDVAVMLERTRDELTAIQALWPRFENVAGLRGRHMYAMVDLAAGSYAACTPIRDGDDPDRLGLETGLLPGGRYLRAVIAGDPPGIYDRIAPSMRSLVAQASLDPARPLVEYYRRHDRIELWAPIAPPGGA